MYLAKFTSKWLMFIHRKNFPMPSQPFLVFILREILLNCPGWARIWDLPALAAQSAGIIEIGNHSLLNWYFWWYKYSL